MDLLCPNLLVATLQIDSLTGIEFQILRTRVQTHILQEGRIQYIHVHIGIYVSTVYNKFIPIIRNILKLHIKLRLHNIEVLIYLMIL